MLQNFLAKKQLLLLRQLLFFFNSLTTEINYIILSKYLVELHIKNNKSFFQTFLFLKKQWFCQYKTVVEIAASDYPAILFRFRLVYSILSYRFTNRLNIIVQTNEINLLESLTQLFPGTGWQEREVWDFFGIYFQGNPDLRRILTDYGFWGHPLRKDFPLTGFYEVFFDDRKKQIMYRPVSLAQEFRDFGAINPWLYLRHEKN